MDIASLLGILAGIGLIVLGIYQLTPNFMIFVSMASLLIVAGGSFAATLLSFSLSDVFGLLRSTFAVFKKQKIDLPAEVDAIVELAPIARKSMQELEKLLGNVRNYFLRDGLQMVVDGYNPDEIREILET